MAIATAAGMFTSLVLTLLIVPVFNLKLDDGVEWLRGLAHRRSGAPEAKPQPAVEPEPARSFGGGGV
jgi:hypothetical protein